MTCPSATIEDGEADGVAHHQPLDSLLQRLVGLNRRHGLREIGGGGIKAFARMPSSTW